MKPKTELSQKLDAFKNMPPLYHKLPDEDFDISKSEVLAWIATQDDILDLARDRARWHGLIVFDSDTGKWQGIDYEWS